MRKRMLGYLLLALFGSAYANEAVKTVENGLEPKDKPLNIVFEKELVFGADEDDLVFVWGSTQTDMTVDDRGHFFVADTKNSQIHEFNDKGEFVATVVKKGQGPGEASYLRNYTAFNDGAVMLEAGFGMPKFTWFDAEGKPTTQTVESTQPLIQTMRADPTGNYLAAMWVKVEKDSPNMLFKYGILDRNLNVLKVLTEVELPMPTREAYSSPQAFAQQTGKNTAALQANFGLMAFDQEGHVYVASADKYEITKYKLDTLDKPLLKITKKYKPHRMPEAEVAAIVDTVLEGMVSTPLSRLTEHPDFRKITIEHTELPPVMNPVGGLATTEDGHLLVMHHLGYAIPTVQADVFDTDGHYIGRASWDSYSSGGIFKNTMIFKNGKAYALLRDEAGEIRAARFNYKVTK